MSETPNSAAGWGSVAVVILAAFTAFVQAYSALSGSDAAQDRRLGNIERVLCTTDDVARQRACRMAGIAP